jgi:hypothetical protein
MMRTSRDFYGEILKAKPAPVDSYSEYGSRVMPALELYKSLKSYEERRAYQDALELMLRDESTEVRGFAVDVCLGFFVFRNAI